MSALPVCAVITASSNTGSACIEELLTRYAGTVVVRAAFRTEERAAPLRSAQGTNPLLEIVIGVDAAEPATLAPLFSGCSIAYIVTPLDHSAGFGKDSDLNANMINAAVAAGVSHIVFGGSWTVIAAERIPDISGRFVGAEKLLTDLAAEGKVKWTSIRGGWYAANTVGIMAASIKATGSFRLPGNIYLPPIDTDDIGRSAAAVIAAGGVGHEGKAYEMSGPERLNGPAFAAAFALALGRPITHVDVPIDEFVARLPKFAADLMRYLDSEGMPAVPLSSDVAALTGRVTSFPEWLEAHKASFL